jgi:hypothetical protein
MRVEAIGSRIGLQHASRSALGDTLVSHVREDSPSVTMGR